MCGSRNNDLVSLAAVCMRCRAPVRVGKSAINGHIWTKECRSVESAAAIGLQSVSGVAMGTREDKLSDYKLNDAYI